MHTQNMTQSQWKDIRTPTSVHRVKQYTVSVFDEEQYASNIAEYYGDDPVTATATRATKKHTYTSFEKQKGNKYNWTSSVSLRNDVRATSHMDNKVS